MSNSRSLSGHSAVGSRRAADGSRNEASKSIGLCILQEAETKNGGVVTCIRKAQHTNLKFRLRSNLDLWPGGDRRRYTNARGIN